MPSRLTFAAGAAVALLAAPLPATADRAPAPVEMRGTITLTGSTGFVRELVLRTPTRFTPEQRTVAARGGRYAGFVLRKHGRDILTTPTAASIWAGYCLSRGCASPAWNPRRPLDLFTGSSTPTNTHEIAMTLSPGHYRLTFVADGQPATVTLRFPGTGQTTLTRGTRAAHTIDVAPPTTLGPQTPAGATGQFYAAGATHRSPSATLFAYLTSWKYVYGPPRSANAQGVCVFDGPPPSAARDPYQYPCGGTEYGNVYAFGQRPTSGKTGPNALLDEYVISTDAFGLHPNTGSLSVGGFINGASPATSAHTTLLWVDLP